MERGGTEYVGTSLGEYKEGLGKDKGFKKKPRVEPDPEKLG